MVVLQAGDGARWFVRNLLNFSLYALRKTRLVFVVTILLALHSDLLPRSGVRSQLFRLISMNLFGYTHSSMSSSIATVVNTNR